MRVHSLGQGGLHLRTDVILYLIYPVMCVVYKALHSGTLVSSGQTCIVSGLDQSWP